MHDLSESLYEFWRIIQPGAHLEASDAQLFGFVTRLMINLPKGLDVI